MSGDDYIYTPVTAETMRDLDEPGIHPWEAGHTITATRNVPVRRHINWNNHRPDLKEDLAHLVQDIKRRICGIASAGVPLFSV